MTELQYTLTAFPASPRSQYFQQGISRILKPGESLTDSAQELQATDVFAAFTIERSLQLSGDDTHSAEPEVFSGVFVHGYSPVRVRLAGAFCDMDSDGLTEARVVGSRKILKNVRFLGLSALDEASIPDIGYVVQAGNYPVFVPLTDGVQRFGHGSKIVLPDM